MKGGGWARSLSLLFCLLFCVLAACGDEPLDGYARRLDSLTTYDALSSEGSVKYLARVDGRDPIVRADRSECLFQDTARFRFHIQFLREIFAEHDALDTDTYASLVLREASRRAYGGAVEWRERITHPESGQPGIYTYFVYQDDGPDASPSVDQIVELDQRLKGCGELLERRLVFVPNTPGQETFARTHEATLRSRGVAIRYLRELVERDYVAYSQGESYGYLHVIPRGEEVPNDFGARDIIVAEAAPPDLTTLAGFVSILPQSPLSHTNLRLQERGFPSVMWTLAYEDAGVGSLANQLVRVVAGADAISFEAATLEDAQAFWDARQPSLGPVGSDLEVTELHALSSLTHEDALAFGAKAANLGELRAILPAGNGVEGFAIPFSAYDAYIAHNNLGPAIDALLTDPSIHTDRAYRDARLDDLRDAIRDGELQPGFFDALTTRMREAFGPDAETTFIRFRSSTNAEDLDEISGAGLYDSKTGCLADDLDGDLVGPSRCLSSAHRAHLEDELRARRAELIAHPERVWLEAIIADIEGDLTGEKPVANALRKVWRSLWNLRAFDEREYWGIDHRDVYMGVAVHPSFVMEQREAVVLTNTRPDEGAPMYRVVSQMGEIGVVRPDDPTAVPETMTFRRLAGDVVGDVRVVVPSSLSEGGAALWGDAEREELAGLLFVVQDHFARVVYPGIEGLRLDVEVEVTVDGRVVLKQARPFLGLAGG